jgi:RimJ/RimL family protein N-acetyltransferase
MRPLEFAEYHGAALEIDEARHNLILGILGRMAEDKRSDVRQWTLGAPGRCAVQMPPYPIVLGELGDTECRALAEQTLELDYPGVVGPELTAESFADRAGELGLGFLEPIPQQIHALTDMPIYPGAPGSARLVHPDDAHLFADWMTAFTHEAIPHDPVPSRERLFKLAGESRHVFWTVDDEPVSMAGIVRRTRHAAAIAAVYTPPELRGRGYAGSVTAAVVERVFAEGKSIACLNADLRNPFSNRCYAKIGFKPVCSSWHYPRA